MKNIFIIYSCLSLSLLIGLFSCTDRLDDLNDDPNRLYVEDLSAAGFIVKPQFELFAPNRYPYWRANLLLADRYAGHFNVGHSSSWWSDELGYNYNTGYTDASWDWLTGCFGSIDTYSKFVEEGGDFENQYMYATALIMRAMYFQIYTDSFGEIPCSETGKDEVLLPKFDTQKQIYEQMIGELDQAMNIIGSATLTGTGLDDISATDLYCGGDLQKWKKLANSLKLRMGMRAYGAEGADFARKAITEALASPLLEADDNILMEKDHTASTWKTAAYGDLWYPWGAGGYFTVGKTLIDYLRNFNDPRLSQYARPAEGGEIIIAQAEEGSTFTAVERDRIDFILSTLDDADAKYTLLSNTGSLVKIELEKNQYIGFPSRINQFVKPYAKIDLFSTPSLKLLVEPGADGEFPELVFTTANVYFLRAHAAVIGLSGEDANALFQEGIAQAMKLWDVNDADIASYLANSTIADISSGTIDEKIEKIAIQRWLASYTDGFEAWSIVRKTGYPKELAEGVSDFSIYGIGTTGGVYPQRLRYGTGAASTNGENLNIAIGRQGADLQSTKLWWAK